MQNPNRSEQGQAIILIVFAIIGLVGMTALAVDGGRTYSERRRAQNAADATALAAAYTKVYGGDVYAQGLARAATNNFVDSNATAQSSNPKTNIEIYNPPISGTYAGDSEYIQVFITDKVQTFFGRVIGIKEITNKVYAVARARPPITTPMAFGNALVGLSPEDCKSVIYQGNANTVITGSGIYVNSNCADSAFFNNANAGSLTAPCLQSVGGIVYEPGAINIPAECIITGVPPLPEITYPDPTCIGNATHTGNVMSPGNFTGVFPPAGVTNLQPGIYCVYGNFRLNAGDSLSGSEVLIVIETGDIRINGGAHLDLHAPTSGPFKGLLIFMPESNDNEIVINGDSSSSLTGAILAPSSDITIDGTGSTTGLDCQIIGYTVKLSGTSTMNINYDDDNNWDAPIPASIELVQ